MYKEFYLYIDIIDKEAPNRHESRLVWYSLIQATGKEIVMEKYMWHEIFGEIWNKVSIVYNNVKILFTFNPV